MPQPHRSMRFPVTGEARSNLLAKKLSEECSRTSYNRRSMPLCTEQRLSANDEVNNATRGELKRISADDSKVQVWVVPTNEELLIARDTLELISK